MAYSINSTDSSFNLSVPDGGVNSTYSQTLIGRNKTNYGSLLAENTLHQLESFASNTAPSTPLTGQLWFSKSDTTLRVYDGSNWERTSTVEVKATAPTSNVTSGTMYFDTKTDELLVYNGGWNKALIPGGEVTDAYTGLSSTGSASIYGSQVETLYLTEASTGKVKSVLALKYVSNGTDNAGANTSTSSTVMGVISDHDAFAIVNTDPYYTELSNASSIGVTINKGLTLRSDYSASTILAAATAVTANVSYAVNIQDYDPVSGNPIASSGTQKGGYDLFGNWQNLIPDTDSAYTIGNATVKYSHIYGQNMTVGPGDASASGIFVDGSAVDLGATGSRFNKAWLKDLDVSGDVTFGAGTQNFGTSVAPIENMFAANVTFSGTAISSTTPSAATHITNKTYVDTEIASATSSTNVVRTTGTQASIAGAKTFTNILTGSAGVSDGTMTMSSGAITGGISASFTGTVTATTFSGTATQAQYADLAEIYATDEDYPEGTVVKFGGDKEVTQTTEGFDNDVFGVISTTPAYLMNKDAEGQPIALQGRVPVRVIGKIAKGERLVSSDIPGMAWALGSDDYDPRQVIGRSLEEKEDGESGIIEAVIGVK